VTGETLKPLRAPHDEDFHDLIAERYENAATILTSNLDELQAGIKDYIHYYNHDRIKLRLRGLSAQSNTE
jgi:DNA replication protein DnaC